jgi:hypothetical protein
VDFCELNDKAIKGLIYLSWFVRRFCLYFHELLLKYLLMNEYVMAHIEKDKLMDDPNA